MNWLVPALCFVLALAMLVAAFAVWAIGAPEPSIELHRATAAGDEQERDVLESQLRDQQFQHNLLLGCLFVGSGFMFLTAFLSMRPAEGRRRRR